MAESIRRRSLSYAWLIFLENPFFTVYFLNGFWLGLISFGFVETCFVRKTQLETRTNVTLRGIKWKSGLIDNVMACPKILKLAVNGFSSFKPKATKTWTIAISMRTAKTKTRAIAIKPFGVVHFSIGRFVVIVSLFWRMNILEYNMRFSIF